MVSRAAQGLARAAQGPNGVHAVARALEILKAFTPERPCLGVSEVSRLLRMPKTTAYRMLVTLQAGGFLRQDPETGKFRLTPVLLRLAHVVTVQHELGQVARPFMHQLTARTGETTALSVVQGHQRVVIEKVECAQELRAMTYVGQTAPLYAGASGKVLLAFLRPERVEEVLRQTGLAAETPHTPCEPDRLLRELDRIRSEGYALSKGERVVGVHSVAAPVRDHAGDVVASLSLVGPSVRFGDERMAEVVPLVLDTAGVISRALGWSGAGAAAVRG
ncbi:MAG: IclR family transcriptional regulator [Clostridia bacterium]|nr:IclR family transcriptional regulator [Clostridia bacterium]